MTVLMLFDSLLGCVVHGPMSNKTHVQKRRIGADNDVVDRISEPSSCQPANIYVCTKMK